MGTILFVGAWAAGVLVALWCLAGVVAWGDYHGGRPKGSTLGLGQVLRLGPLAWLAMLVVRVPGAIMGAICGLVLPEGPDRIRDAQGRVWRLEEHGLVQVEEDGVDGQVLTLTVETHGSGQSDGVS